MLAQILQMKKARTILFFEFQKEKPPDDTVAGGLSCDTAQSFDDALSDDGHLVLKSPVQMED